jgi:hypothetical protein
MPGSRPGMTTEKTYSELTLVIPSMLSYSPPSICRPISAMAFW